MREVTCQQFEEQLEALVSGQLPQSERDPLEGHARSCPECGMQLRMGRYLASASLRDLEARVPQELVADMWPRVEARLGELGAGDSGAIPAAWRDPDEDHGALRRIPAWPRSGSRPGPRSRPRPGPGGWHLSWLRPALAAVSLALLVAGGFMLGEIHQLRQQQRELTGRLQQQDLLLQQQVRLLAGERPWRSNLPGSLAAAILPGVRWRQALADHRAYTAAELTQLVAALAPETQVLSAAAIEVLLQRNPVWRSWARRPALSAIDPDDGLQAGEVIHLLDALDLPPDTKISTTRLLRLARANLDFSADRASGDGR